MVYVPYEVVKRLMLSKWGSELHFNIYAPKPTEADIRLEWFRVLDFYPLDRMAFESFLDRFPAADQHTIKFRPYDKSILMENSPRSWVTRMHAEAALNALRSREEKGE